MENETGAVALKPLTPFIGSWRLEASFGAASPADIANSDDESASVTFEWALGGQFLAQHSRAPHPAPDSLAIVSFDAACESYVQHYFDSRGVVRV